MRKKEGLGTGCAAAGLGVIPGVLIMGPVVFANGASILSSERLVPVILSYVILGSIGGAISAWQRATASTWRIVIWLTLPGFGMVFFMGKDIGLIFQLVYCAVPFSSACLGVAVVSLIVRLVVRRE
jgi:hypothetical protein